MFQKVHVMLISMVHICMSVILLGALCVFSMKHCTKTDCFSCFSETDTFWVCGIVTVNHELFIALLSFSVALVFFNTPALLDTASLREEVRPAVLLLPVTDFKNNSHKGYNCPTVLIEDYSLEHLYGVN